MDLIEDSLMNDSDWLSDHAIGLENTLWDSLSDRGNFQIYQAQIWKIETLE